ncbi:MAG: carboxypeptidase regulatory-like domain-containing protein [Bacteroidales bacterium]|nr:carboxypeptidase regulatory-like domain-containing protein [Bacteroidales bacterium]
MKKLLLLATVLVVVFSYTMGQNAITNSFFDHVNYSGAFGDNDWTAPWAEWDPVNATYPVADSTISAGNITGNVRLSSGQSPLFGIQSFTNPRLNDGWFTVTNYIGAFDDSNDWTSPWAEFDPQNAVYPPTTVTINAGNITTNTTWTSGNVYKLNGFVYVKDGATLTIQAGTIIRGDKANKGTLIIERGAKLIAQGTAANPIVFTSNQAAGFRTYGDWGGVILLGKATINVPGGVATIEGGVGSQFGGGATPNDNDNSGILEYVRIEFPGIAFEPNNEINGLTLGGVGKGTTMNHIQVSYSGDDAYEWFGGAVDAKHLIAFRTWDDDFDTDFGFTGRIQFGVVLRDPAISDPGSNSRAFESDNDGSGSSNTPITRPFFSNISVFGPLATTSTTIDSYYDRAIYIRRNSATSIYNSVITGWPVGLRINNDGSEVQANNNNLQIENTIMAGMRDDFFYNAFNETYFNTASRNNSILTKNSSLRVIDPFDLTSPNFLLQNGNRVYELDGWVYVKNGATLTVDPGTVFRCTETSGPGTFQGAALIVERGAKLIAEGTAAKPIVFTSSKASGLRSNGDWGGIIMLGYATMNQPGGTGVIEGGVGSTYGGGASPNDNDDSGILKYVRIEFAGSEFAPNNEINGLTMGGVGSGTTLDYIQVSYGADDCYEWFGGTVNAKHLISYRGTDDCFDGDEGWLGMVQYAVAVRDPGISDLAGSSNGFEISNHGPSTYLPVTHPIFSNVTMLLQASAITSPNFGDAFNLKDNTEIGIYNTITCGWPTGLDFSGSGVIANANAGLLDIENTLMAEMTALYDGTDEQTFYTAPARDNGTFANCTDFMLTNPFAYNNNNDFTLMDASPLWHRSRWTYSLSGVVTYDNLFNSPLSNVTITISPKETAKGKVLSASTNASGQYTFPRLGNGSYEVSISTTNAWPSGVIGAVDATDGFFIQQHFLGNISLTGLKLEAGDVTGEGTVNTADALTAVRRGSALPAPAWGIDDWLFNVPTIDINDANATGVDIKGIVGGDVDGSYIP